MLLGRRTLWPYTGDSRESQSVTSAFSLLFLKRVSSYEGPISCTSIILYPEVILPPSLLLLSPVSSCPVISVNSNSRAWAHEVVCFGTFSCGVVLYATCTKSGSEYRWEWQCCNSITFFPSRKTTTTQVGGGGRDGGRKGETLAMALLSLPCNSCANAWTLLSKEEKPGKRPVQFPPFVIWPGWQNRTSEGGRVGTVLVEFSYPARVVFLAFDTCTVLLCVFWPFGRYSKLCWLKSFIFLVVVRPL